MNRRSFLCALAVAPIAAAVAPFAVEKANALASVAEEAFGVTTWRVARRMGKAQFLTMNPARSMQAIFEEGFGKTPVNDAIFDDWAAYCDQIVDATEMEKAYV